MAEANNSTYSPCKCIVLRVSAMNIKSEVDEVKEVRRCYKVLDDFRQGKQLVLC